MTIHNISVLKFCSVVQINEPTDYIEPTLNTLIEQSSILFRSAVALYIMRIRSGVHDLWFHHSYDPY